MIKECGTKLRETKYEGFKMQLSVYRIYETNQSLLSLTTDILVKLINEAKKKKRCKIFLRKKRRGSLNLWKQMSECVTF